MIIFISKFVYKIRVKECEREKKNQKILLFNIKCEGYCCLFLLKQWINWTLDQTYQGKKLSQKGKKILQTKLFPSMSKIERPNLALSQDLFYLK